MFKKIIAEFIGTFVLVFCACGAAILTDTVVGAALAFGLVIVAMAYSIGNVSGCYINPVVSFAMFLRKEIDFKTFLAYVCAQVCGAFIGSLLLAVCLGFNFGALGGNEIQALLKEVDGFELKLTAVSYIAAFISEIVLTMIFVLAILGATDSKQPHGKRAGLIIGGALVLVHLLGLSLTGTSVNPARSLAPAVLQAFAGNATSLAQIWIWLIAPMVGAACAVILYNVITGKKKAE